MENIFHFYTRKIQLLRLSKGFINKTRRGRDIRHPVLHVLRYHALTLPEVFTSESTFNVDVQLYHQKRVDASCR